MLPRNFGVPPISRSGHPQPSAESVDGAVLHVAEHFKQMAYPEGHNVGFVLGLGVGKHPLPSETSDGCP